MANDRETADSEEGTDAQLPNLTGTSWGRMTLSSHATEEHWRSIVTNSRLLKAQRLECLLCQLVSCEGGGLLSRECSERSTEGYVNDRGTSKAHTV